MTTGQEDTINSLNSRNREALLAVRREMLNRVTYLTSEELVLGDDLHRAGRLFGVLFEHQWYYPLFQLDSQGGPFPEMSSILEHLPDNYGWDRLQWFLESNPVLGRSPVEVWNAGDRTAVLQTARQEIWQGRD